MLFLFMLVAGFSRHSLGIYIAHGIVAHRQHTSAALTVNENYDRGGHTAWMFLMTQLRCH